MLNVLRLDQDFAWDSKRNIYRTNNIEEFQKLTHPKIALINDYRWHDFDRSSVDMAVYWTSESLAFERSEGEEIRILSNKDRIFSSSICPTNNHNLHFFCQYFKEKYNKHYRNLIPKNEIFENNMLSTLGESRLHRCYMYCKFAESNLLNRNVSYVFRCLNIQRSLDKNNELPGQSNMYRFVTKNIDVLPKTSKRLEFEWRKYKSNDNFYKQSKPGILDSLIIPTKAYHDSSLLYISETVPHNKEFFLTEKTIKGLLSGRPFIVIGCVNFLNHLKSLGFRTWQEVLDESYDEEENLDKRIDLSVASAKEFIAMNVLNYPKKLALIQEITNHNKKVFFDTKWNLYQDTAVKLILKDLGLNYHDL